MSTGCETIDRAGGHYTIITADSHAGGSHAAYREYLDPKYRDEFDAWRSKYRNPYKDLGDQRRFRNWDTEMRNGQIFVNDIDDAIADVRWIKDHGLRGGLLLPNVPPDAKWVRPLYDPEYD